MELKGFHDKGWAILPANVAQTRWSLAAAELGRRVTQDPEQQAKWLQCEGTWFVGVDALPSDDHGAVAGVPLPTSVQALMPPDRPLHRAQLSVVYPGYPKPRAGESAAGFRFRRDRCAAHVDGLIPRGPLRNRYLLEPHAVIIGIALTKADQGASPLTVWDASHHLIGAALRAHLAQVPPEAHKETDLTDVYTEVRRRCFDTCQQSPLSLNVGQCVVLHRHLLHGIAPWQPGASADPLGRMMTYFRPMIRGGTVAWLG